MLTGACAGRLLARGPAGGAARSGVPRFWSRELGQAHLFLRVDCQRLIAKGKWKESFLFICKWKSDEDRASLHQRFHFQSRGFQKGGRPWGGRRARPGPRAFPRQPGPARPLVQATCLVWKVRTCRGHTRAAARPRLSVRGDPEVQGGDAGLLARAEARLEILLAEPLAPRNLTTVKTRCGAAPQTRDALC